MNQTLNIYSEPSRMMLILGYLGLIPFVGLSVLICFEMTDFHQETQNILNIYSFGIIAFLCGNIWPKSEVASKNKNAVISNMIFLLTFFCYLLLPSE